MLEITNTIRVPLDEFQWSFARSGGPGGQNVNKVASKAVLRWPVAVTPSLPEYVRQRLVALQRRRVTAEGDLLVVSQRYRDQDRNKTDCLDKLAQMVREAATLPRPRKATRPSKGSQRRRLAEKRQRSQTKAGRRTPAGEI
jgi:ribosome-associated protein